MGITTRKSPGTVIDLHDSMSPNPVVLIVAERRINSRAGSAWIIPRSMDGDGNDKRDNGHDSEQETMAEMQSSKPPGEWRLS